MRISRKTSLLTLAIPILLLALAIVIPQFADRSSWAPNNECINRLRQIDAAKRQWALDNHKTNGPLTWSDIIPRYWRDPKSTTIPQCPKGGFYTLGEIGEPPKCSVDGHTIP